MSKCLECYWAFEKDYGYSNWTTEGTDFICLLDKHPDGEFDRWYGEDKRLEYANLCDRFIYDNEAPLHACVEDYPDDVCDESDSRFQYVQEVMGQ